MGEATTLASTWCLKMEHYFVLYLESGVENYAFTEEDCTSFEEPRDFLELCESLQGPRLARAQHVRNLRPRA